ncbi:MAG: acid shock protein [Ahniella sp.]|nr:acid shock protein [Ahniella sp.]
MQKLLSKVLVAALMGAGTAGFALAPMADAQAKPAKKQIVKPARKAAPVKAPPKGAKRAKNMRFNKGLKWKTDAKTKSAFAVGPKQEIWFMDPDTGWAYTVDRAGWVYTADPYTGIVYALGDLNSWVGDLLYFFSFWDYSGGSFSVPNVQYYTDIYVDVNIVSYDVNVAYTEVWEYEVLRIHRVRRVLRGIHRGVLRRGL